MSKNALKERLLKNSKWNGECLESTYKGRSQSGYALIKINGSTSGAHRISWKVHFGEIPDGLWVLHKCDNPLCINPEHLFLGKPIDNSRDMIKKKRHNYQGMAKYSDSLVQEALQKRENGMTHKDIAKDLKIPMGTLNSFFRRNSLKDKVKNFYGIPKYSKETRILAKSMNQAGVKCKDIQAVLGIPKRSLTRILHTNYIEF